MFVITGGGWLVLIITAMTQLPASSFIPSFVRLIIICLLPLRPVHSEIRDPKGSWCCWRQLSYFSLFLYGIRVASTGVYFVPKPLCRRKLASALCRKPRILSRTSSEPLCSLLGCSGLGGFSELDPGGSALQILQDAHNSTARKLSQSLLPSI